MVSIVFIVCLLLPAMVLAKDFFRAGVFEHRPEYTNYTGVEFGEVIEASLKVYEKVAVLAAENGVDLLLYNEYGIVEFPLTRDDYRKIAERIPDPKKAKINPCTESAADRPILHRLSCLAKNNNIYVVANLIDGHPCEDSCDAQQIDSCETKCPPDNVYLYNTNVAFDREGNFIARYRKRHPYFELVNIPEEPEFVTFDTEFGKFGMIICFDSVWEESMLLARDYNIDNLLFPHFWFDDMVPLNAVEFQQAWALANRVNFIAANTQTPYQGSLGSGIYSKDDGALVYTYEPDDKSKLLLANVKVKGNSDIPSDSVVLVVTEDEVVTKVETGEYFPEHCYDKLLGPSKDFSDYRCFTMVTENYTVAKLEFPSGNLKACSNGFCCFLTYTAEGNPDDFYLAAFNGLNNIDGFYHFWEETCLLVKCIPFEGKECRLQPTKSKTVFTEATLSAKFDSKAVIYPTVSETNVRLAFKKDWYTESFDSVTKLHFKSTSHRPLLKIGLMGRNYHRDAPFIDFYQHSILTDV